MSLTQPSLSLFVNMAKKLCKDKTVLVVLILLTDYQSYDTHKISNTFYGKSPSLSYLGKMWKILTKHLNPLYLGFWPWTIPSAPEPSCDFLSAPKPSMLKCFIGLS